MQNIIASQSQHKIKEEDRLLNFIKTHKENIFKMHKLLQENNCGFRVIFMHDNADMLIRLAKHDNSKYSKEEFDGYRINFYPTKEEENKIKTSAEYANMVKTNYENALQHHYKYNTHHPQHYVDSDGSIRDMPVEDVYEMILDWMANMYFYTKDPIVGTIEHYESIRDTNLLFSDNTLGLLDYYIFDELQYISKHSNYQDTLNKLH